MAAPSTALSRKELHTAHSAAPNYSINMIGHTTLEARKSHLIPLPPQYSLPGSVLSNDLDDCKYVMDIKPSGGCGVVIGFCLMD